MFVKSSIVVILALGLCQLNSLEARRVRSSNPQCQQDECNLSPQHFALYSEVKRAADSEFDFSGKELVPVIRAMDVLKKRYIHEDPAANNSKLVKSLFDDNKILKIAEQVFGTSEGKALVELYRSSVNGQSQNLACSSMRIASLEDARRKLASNQDLAQIFNKIHSRYEKKSAKKCLKSACNSIDVYMSKLDSVLRRNQRSEPTPATSMDTSSDKNGLELTAEGNSTLERREFESQELELCRFFTKSNKEDCRVSGADLNGLSFTNSGENSTAGETRFKEYLQSYKGSKTSTGDDLNQVRSSVLSQCEQLEPLLTYYMSPIKWYMTKDLIDEQKFVTRTIWCPNLSYWWQVDRLCKEMQATSAELDKTPSLIQY